MAKPTISTKRVAISKANAQMVAVVGAASFVTIFCLVAAQAVWGQNQYQARVSSAKEKANQQLLANIEAFDDLEKAYFKFDRAGTNVIGGNSKGTGDKDGSNAKIILDALPGSYDFPALTSSLEKILTERNFEITNITGTDDQLNQGSSTSSPQPTAVEMPFSFSVTNANYSAVQELLATLDKSIRPIQIDSITLSGGVDDMTITVNAHTYFQPAKNLTIKKQVVK